jgi:PIN domain nuclease of toxin-antitoxin system
MDDVIIDTNVVIWYFTLPAIPSNEGQEAVSKAFDTGTIYVSSITLVELIYLVEKGRIPADVLASLKTALDNTSSAFKLVALDREISDRVADIPRKIVPDMPDRIIAATAIHLDLPLITSDTDIRKLTIIESIW